MRPNTYLLIAVLALLFQGANLRAQINPNKRMMSFGPQPALEVSLPNADEDLIIDVWKHYLKKYGKVKRNKKAGEYYLEDERINPIAKKKEISIYMIPEKEQAVVFIDLKNGFLSQEREEYNAAVRFLENYQKAVEIERYKRWIEQEKKKLKSLNKKLTKLSKREKKLHGRIEEARRIIKESEEELKENNAAQKANKTAIEQQVQEINTLLEALEKLESSDK